MRKTIKVGVIMLVVGVIMLIFGIANNGIKSIYWSNNGFKIVKKSQKTYYPDKITDITLNSADNVTVKRGNVASVLVSSRHKLPTVTTKNGHVTVSSQPTSQKQVGYFFSDSDFDNRIVITVPTKTPLTWIRGTHKQSGDVHLEDVTADHVKLLNGDNTVSLSNVQIKKDTLFSADTLSLTNVTAPSLQVEAGADGGTVRIQQSHFKAARSVIKSNDGDISIEQTHFKSAKLHTQDGDIRLNRNHVDSLTATTADGDIHLSANKRVGVFATSDDGDLNIFSHHVTDNTDYHHNKDAKQQYHLTTQDGDITATPA